MERNLPLGSYERVIFVFSLCVVRELLPPTDNLFVIKDPNYPLLFISLPGSSTKFCDKFRSSKPGNGGSEDGSPVDEDRR